MRHRFLASLLAAVLCVPFAVAQHAFEVVTIKPSRPEETGQHWNIENNLTQISGVTLRDLVQNAYLLRTQSQVLGGPDWVSQERFDVTAKASEAEYRRLVGQGSEEAYGDLLKAMLVDRFHLKANAQTRVMPRYVLQTDGPVKMTPSPLDANGKPKAGRRGSGGRGVMNVYGLTMQDLADVLSGRPEVGGRTVVNETRLTGYYDFTLKWAPDDGTGIAADAVEPGLLDAVRDQLGLRLKKDDGPVPVVVVESAEKPDFD